MAWGKAPRHGCLEWVGATHTKLAPFTFWEGYGWTSSRQEGQKVWTKNEERPQRITKDFIPYLASNGQFLHNTKPRTMCPDLGFRKCEMIQQAREGRAGKECDGEEESEEFWFWIPISSSPRRCDLTSLRKSSHRSLISIRDHNERIPQIGEILFFLPISSLLKIMLLCIPLCLSNFSLL